MTPTPDDANGRFNEVRRRVRARAAAHRLAQAARNNPAPTYLTTGHFAPPDSHAVWHLPLSDGAMFLIVWREATDEFVTHFRPAEGVA